MSGIATRPESLRWPQVCWLHCNVYDDAAMATRFGLHGIPTFFVFRRGKRVGRITSWPGIEAFGRAVETALSDAA